MQREQIDEALAELDRRLQKYRQDRYPVQHATAQFHRGVLLLEANEVAAAREAFEVAVALFDPSGLPVEHAKATNMLGAALRAGGEAEHATRCFEVAADTFEAAELPFERGAALFNLGLARREAGDLEGSSTSLREARALLDFERVPNQAAAAARELGITLLHSGDLPEAVLLLREAVDVAQRIQDHAGIGAASNALGLALLALHHHEDAVAVFADAAASDARSVRPAAHATAKANLALAYEAGGELARARLSASQAAVIPEAPEAVVMQAEGVLQRLASTGNDLITVVRDEAEASRTRIFHDELLRWLDVGRDQRVCEAEALAIAIVDEDAADSITQAWLGALLELPPSQMDEIITTTLIAIVQLPPEQADPFRQLVSRAMVAFPIPQWDRLRATFNRVANSLGQEASWT